MNMYGLEPGLHDFGFSMDPYPVLCLYYPLRQAEEEDGESSEAPSRWNLASPFWHGLEPSPKWEEVK
ncbi:hypothetical protein RHMOL_Rhmol03G0177800 [Rhododendron molle]|uniref:Uncharacterized protein n=1 Tax=Rhododendron molle TaxID=49168 RepID=A0ACC0PFA9_RHOML|nr:hypothetical protein RHMOL_Rhmol03G0177800 [Rhododendron molle]